MHWIQYIIFKNYVLYKIKKFRIYPETVCLYLKRIKGEGFPGGTVVKNPPASAGDTGSSPGPGRSHMPRSN